MKPSEDIAGVISDIYAGVMDDAAWQRAMVGIADHVGASGAHMLSVNPQLKIVLRDESYRIDGAVAELYRQHYCAHDILVEPILRSTPGKPTPDYQLVPIEAWRSSMLFNELAVPFDVPYVLPTVLRMSPSRIVALSLKTSMRHGPFLADEITRLKALIPHVTRAIEIKDRLARMHVQTATLVQSLESLHFGVLVLDAAGHIVAASAAAEQTLRQRDSGVFRNLDGSVGLREPAQTELFRWIVDGRPPAGVPSGLLQVVRPGALPISVMAYPLPEAMTTWIGSGPQWLLVLFDSEQRLRVSAELIGRNLGVTRREAEIAAMIVAGHDLKSIAARLNISINTARNHLKATFAKTGIHSQAELARRIAGGPYVLINDVVHRRQ